MNRVPRSGPFRRGRLVGAACLALAAAALGTPSVAVPSTDFAPYTCGVGPGPFQRCDRVYASAGETVTVAVAESGTVTRGDFQAVDRRTGGVLGTVQNVTPSSGTVTLWRNDTGSVVIVDLSVTSDDSGRINGSLTAGP
ncbi:hypothetical protein [Streptomyces sp. Isolate_45]|uniref:hypothetical protein n=1 Tax=Streptomyces sp. Isolate_45 TaxID=2950111 RepID=UPI002481B62C|nr:hypothetical protein [Streptomyces sp. Isolate_45]MDA5279977.1 hypothetical protein [Streptomyces sp. Isolate_45]